MRMHKPLLVAALSVLLVAVFALLLPHRSAAADCAAQPGDYRIKVVPVIPKARLDHTKPRSEMSRIAGVPVLGLHTMGLRARLDVEPSYYPVVGGHCFWVTAVEVEIRAESPYVFVAAEYPEGSCNYNVILAHEDDHAITAKRVIENFEPDFRRPLTSLAIPKAHAPVFVDEPDAAYARVTEKIWDLVMPVLEDLSRTMDEAQRKVDSEREYRRLYRQCARW